MHAKLATALVVAAVGGLALAPAASARRTFNRCQLFTALPG
jgi:hypothetical protein